MKALILAGGFATRLWPLTEKRAKPLLKIAGKPLISHIIEKIPQEIEIIISTNLAFANDFEALKADFPSKNIQIFIEDSDSDASKKGALAATADVIEKHGLREPLLLIAGDNYFDFSIETFVDNYNGKPLIAVFDAKTSEEAKQFGVVSVQDGIVTEFQEKPEHPRSTLVSTGCYIFSPDTLGEIVEYAKKSGDNLGGIFEHLLGRHEIHAFTYAGTWLDIGSFESYLQAHKLLYRHTGTPASTSIRNSSVGESVDLGEGCDIRDSVLENCIIGNNCEIVNCHIRNSMIDNNCRMAGIDLDHKMIRAGTRLEP